MNKLGFILLSALPPALLEGQVVPPETTLSTSDVARDDFGDAVAISGNTVVVGAPYANAAYVFVYQNATWTQQAKLTTGTNFSVGFGASVGISAETIVVGEKSSGANYNATVFVRSGSYWTCQATLNIPHSTFIYPQVAISGDTFVASSYVASPAEDSAYVFVRSGNSWTQQADLVPNIRIGGFFGETVAIDADTAVVGAPGTNLCYVFVRSGGVWSEQAQLNNIGGQNDDRFGDAVAISGDTALVGAPFRDTGAGPEHGAALAFARNGANWSLQATLNPDPNNAYNNPRFGYSVAISGNTALVGTPYYYASGGEIGSVWVFGRNGSQWDGQEMAPTHARASAEHFGAAVAIDGTLAVVGTPQYYYYDLPGRAYVYDGSGACSRFARCDPSVIWVDFAYTGSERGCSDQPYNTLAEGIAAVPAGGSLAVISGTNSVKPKLSKPMKISACGGAVTIGR